MKQNVKVFSFLKLITFLMLKKVIYKWNVATTKPVGTWWMIKAYAYNHLLSYRPSLHSQFSPEMGTNQSEEF